MSQEQLMVIFEDTWPIDWTTLNAVLWRYWKRHAQSTTDNPNILILLNTSKPIVVIRNSDIETEMATYVFYYIVSNDFQLDSGHITIYSLIDNGTRIALSVLPFNTDNYNITLERQQVISQLPSHQTIFLLNSFNAFMRWLPTQSYNKADISNLFLQSPQSILQVINNVGKQFERLPATYAGKTEPELRDHFLLVLEPLFKGSATGETFNKKGKTDILLRADGQNVFIAECKYWDGEKTLIDTIDQLLGYLTRRDTDAAIIMFVRRKEFISTAPKAKETMLKHLNYVLTTKEQDPAWHEYIFRGTEDKNHHIKLTVMLFHIPINQATIAG